MGQIDLYSTAAVQERLDPDVESAVVLHVADEAGKHQLVVEGRSNRHLGDEVLKSMYCSDLTRVDHSLVDKELTSLVAIPNERPDLDVALADERASADLLVVVRSWA